jgi:hypothetical protein
LPRLAFADWLEEHDRPRRAAFIRRQCENARRVEAWKADPWHRAAVAEGVRDPARSFVVVNANTKAGGLAQLLKAPPWSLIDPAKMASPMIVVQKTNPGHNEHQRRAHCIAYYRGFPVVVSCSYRAWSRHWQQFPIVVRGVFVSGQAGPPACLYPNVVRMSSPPCMAEELREYCGPLRCGQSDLDAIRARSIPEGALASTPRSGRRRRRSEPSEPPQEDLAEL